MRTECSASFAQDTVVTLTAAPATGSVFAGWTGACTGTLPTCDVTLAAAANVTATFAVATYDVTVTRAGAGMGRVTGSGLACGATCTITVEHGTMISLSAAPGTLSVFAGWGGACSGNAACMVTVTGTTAITASFALDNLTLFVTRGGNGTGTVASSPAGINCGADCSQTYVANQMVTLTAAPATGSAFTGWSGGGCTGMATCTVTMTAAISVTATFTLTTHALTVTRAGNGMGAVTSTPAGIACGGDCSETYNYNTMVALTATPSTGSTFTGWTGACTGTGACTVTMTAARSVTATFTLQQFTLTVTRSGTGTGSVSGGGISCPTTCSASVNYGSTVMLSATPSMSSSTASRLSAWSGGGCTGVGTCTISNITANTTVNADFTLLPNFIFVTSSLHDGNLGGLTGADAICRQRAADANLPGRYVAYLSSINGNTPINAPSRVGGASGWVRVDQRPVMNSISEMHLGTLAHPPSLTEGGADVGQTQFVLVWTGTNPSGTYQNACSAAAAFIPWGGPFGEAVLGLATSMTSTVVAATNNDCSVGRRLCLGVDRAAIAQ